MDEKDLQAVQAAVMLALLPDLAVEADKLYEHTTTTNASAEALALAFAAVINRAVELTVKSINAGGAHVQ